MKVHKIMVPYKYLRLIVSRSNILRNWQILYTMVNNSTRGLTISLITAYFPNLGYTNVTICTEHDMNLVLISRNKESLLDRRNEYQFNKDKLTTVEPA